MLTLAPHTFYWFSLQPQEAATAAGPPAVSQKDLAEVYLGHNWEQLFTRLGLRQLEIALRQYLDREGIAGEERLLRNVRVRETFRLPLSNATGAESAAYLAIVDVEFNRGSPDTFAVSLAFATQDEAAAWPATGGPKPIARLSGPNPGVLYEAVGLPAFGDLLLQAVGRGSSFLGSNGGELQARHARLFNELRGPETDPLPATAVPFDQTNKLIRYGDRLILKNYRRIEEGIHPEVEIGRFLTEDHPTSCVAPLAGSIVYRRGRNDLTTVAVMHGYVANEGDAWQYSLDVLSVYFEHATTRPPLESPPPLPLKGRLGEECSPPPEFAAEVLHGFLELVQVLGRRLGELHCALASAPERPDFAPEPISLQDQRAIYQSMRNVLFDAFDDLERESHRIPPALTDKAMKVRGLQQVLLKELRAILECRIHATRNRCHGDCRLHQILFTGKDFVFIDFEGRPRDSIGERRIKRSPITDVVSLLRSFDAAAYATLLGLASSHGRATGMVRDEDRPALPPWANAWRSWTHHAIFKGYLEASAGAAFVPTDEHERHTLSRVLLLDYLLTELSRQLRTCSPWLEIPLAGLLEAVNPAD
jgi:maltose alpha-D-glucosyltransferase/alpha-amylase